METNNVKCPKCSETRWKHSYDAAHGIADCYMAGSERFVCKCGFTAYKQEGEKLGLKFQLEH